MQFENENAFPTSASIKEHKGMSLRDYLAAKFMASALIGVEGLGEVSKEERKNLLKQVSKIVYEIADIMLEVRDNET